MSDNNNKKRGFGIHFLFATLNRFVTLLREHLKNRLTGINQQSDNLYFIEKYIGIFRGPLCPHNGNFASKLSLYLEQYKNNNIMIRYILLKASLPVIGITLLAIIIAICSHFVLNLGWKYIGYIIGISPIIYSFFLNSFFSVLLNVHERYAGSSSALILGNLCGLLAIVIPLLLNWIFGIEINSTIVFISLAVVNILYSFVQSVYLIVKSIDLIRKPILDTYVISDTDRENVRKIQKDFILMFFAQSPKYVADTVIIGFVKGVKSGVVSMVNYSHKFATTIMLCLLHPIHHMSYKILNQIKNKNEFRESAADLFILLHMFIVPFVLFVSNHKFLIIFFDYLLPDILKNSDINEFIKIFEVVFYSTYLSCLGRLLKNIMSLSSAVQTLAISSVFGAAIPGGIVVMNIISSKYDIQTGHLNTKVLGEMLKYCLSIGDVVEFLYLMYIAIKNKLIKFSYNQMIILGVTIAAYIITLLTDVSIFVTCVMSVIAMGFAIYNCVKYLNKQ